MTYGGGPEGGYFVRRTGDKEELFEVERNWGTPFSVKPLRNKRLLILRLHYDYNPYVRLERRRPAAKTARR